MKSAWPISTASDENLPDPGTWNPYCDRLVALRFLEHRRLAPHPETRLALWDVDDGEVAFRTFPRTLPPGASTPDLHLIVTFQVSDRPDRPDWEGGMDQCLLPGNWYYLVSRLLCEGYILGATGCIVHPLKLKGSKVEFKV